MIRNGRHIVLYGIRIFLMGFWLYVALDKLWNPVAFHQALLRQPFPDTWADILYWLLPLTELGIAFLFVAYRSPKSFCPLTKHTPYLLSAFLLAAFTLYIGLGLVGLYARRPCGCASIFSRLSWSWHLVANMILLTLSILGWYLTDTATRMEKVTHQEKKNAKATFLSLLLLILLYDFLMVVSKRFPEKFALFPAWAGIAVNYDTCAVPRKKYRRGDCRSRHLDKAKS